MADQLKTNAAQSTKNIPAPKSVLEHYTITTTDWVALTDHSPFTVYAEKQADYDVGATTLVRLHNNNPVMFAETGLVIGAITSGNVIRFWAINQPTTAFGNVTVEFVEV